MEKLQFNGKELELKFGAKAIAAIEKESGKTYDKFGTIEYKENGDILSVRYSIDDIALLLKHGLIGEYSADEVFDIIDQNDGTYNIVTTAAGNSWLKILGVATAGNLESPQA
jgi:hypothetical protein